MKPFAKGLIFASLIASLCGCGGTQGRLGLRSRDRARVRTLPDWKNPSSDSEYAPPVEPPVEQPAQPKQPQLFAPPVNPQDLEPTPRASASIRFEGDLPRPPEEKEESVQFGVPKSPKSSPMPNALFPTESRPILEQSSAERPATREATEVLGEGKIALRMQGNSQFAKTTPRYQPTRLMPIEVDDAPGQAMQVEFASNLPSLPPL